MVGYVDQKSSRGMKKGREVPRKTKAMTGGWLKRVGIWVVLRSFSGSQGLSPGGKKEHSESRSAAFALDDKAVGPRLTSYPTHHVIGRIGGTRGFRLLSVQLPPFVISELVSAEIVDAISRHLSALTNTRPTHNLKSPLYIFCAMCACCES